MEAMGFIYKKIVINNCIIYIAENLFSNLYAIIGIHLVDFEYIKSIEIYINNVIKLEIPIKKACYFFLDNPIKFTDLKQISIKKMEKTNL